MLNALDLTDCPAEQSFRRRMLDLLDNERHCFLRTAYPAHFTGSALVIATDGRILLNHHKKLSRWLQFGGHCDGEEDVLRVAQREALEESGIEDLIASSDGPIDLDIHEIPARADEPAHFHYDVRFVLIAPENAKSQQSDESHELRWFTREEIANLNLDPGLQRLIAKAAL
jgi:8-oxo-dGTP pyrophosphatase MutT (NUDIX family)